MPTTGGGVISPEQIADLNHLLEALPPLPEPKNGSEILLNFAPKM